jgi:uncharacterized protein YlzI (FlbEa/FlbD family)
LLHDDTLLMVDSFTALRSLFLCMLHCDRLHSLSNYVNITLCQSTTAVPHTIITLHTSNKAITKSHEMSDWNLIDKFGKEVAKYAGISKDETWKALLGGRLPDGSEGVGYKTHFDEEDMLGFSEKLKDWISNHRKAHRLYHCWAYRHRHYSSRLGYAWFRSTWSCRR